MEILYLILMKIKLKLSEISSQITKFKSRFNWFSSNWHFINTQLSALPFPIISNHSNKTSIFIFQVSFLDCCLFHARHRQRLMRLDFLMEKCLLMYRYGTRNSHIVFDYTKFLLWIVVNDADDFDELNLMWQLTLFPLVIFYSISLSFFILSDSSWSFVELSRPRLTITWLYMSITRHLMVTVIEESEKMTDGDSVREWEMSFINDSAVFIQRRKVVATFD